MQNAKKDTFVITLNEESLATIIAGGQLKVRLGTEDYPVYVVLQPAPFGQ